MGQLMADSSKQCAFKVNSNKIIYRIRWNKESGIVRVNSIKLLQYMTLNLVSLCIGLEVLGGPVVWI